MRTTTISIILILILICCGQKQDKVERINEGGVEVVINHLEPYKIEGIGSLILEELFKIDTENENITQLGITYTHVFLLA
jgi:hypothetical protein